jgi:hypothetical protein
MSPFLILLNIGLKSKRVEYAGNPQKPFLIAFSTIAKEPVIIQLLRLSRLCLLKIESRFIFIPNIFMGMSI